jgi:GDP-L-fucose synthase
MSAVLAQSYRQQYGFDAIVLVPGNVYGPYDNFNLNSSHVIPALIRKFHEATSTEKNEVTVWGSGKAIRDFVFVDDVCKAILVAAENYSDGDIINISSSIPSSIRSLVELVAELTGFKGRILWDQSKPEGQIEKIFDNTRMKTVLKIECSTPLREGLRKTIEWFRNNNSSARF